MHDFITRCLGHLENTGSLNYADLPIVNSFLFPVKKKSYIINASVGKWWNSWFSKNLTFALELKFYYCNKYCCFSWNDRLIEFEKKSAKYTSLNNHRLSIIYSCKWKMAFMKKAASSRSQVQKSFMCSHHLSKKKKSNKITCIQELRLNKINNFYLFIKDILRWTWIFSKHRVWGAGWLPAQFGATVSTYTKAPGVYPLLHDEKN